MNCWVTVGWQALVAISVGASVFLPLFGVWAHGYNRGVDATELRWHNAVNRQ